MAKKATRQERIRRAMRADQQNELIVARSVRDGSSIWRADAASIANRAASGRPYKGALRKMVRKQEAKLADSMKYLYLRGYNEAMSNAKGHVEDSNVLQLAYTKEINQIIGGLPLTAAEMVIISKKVKKEAKRVLLMAATDLEKAIKVSTRATVEKGLLKRDAIREIKKTVVGVNAAAPYRLDTIYRTSANMSFSAGRWEANQNPAIQSVLWGYEYVTVGDGRVRTEHAAFNGTRLPKGSPRWNSINPPNGWNCRCSTIEIYKDEPIAKTRQPKSGAKVDKEFQFNPGKTMVGAA